MASLRETEPGGSISCFAHRVEARTRFGRHAALRSNVGWPLRYAHYWYALAHPQKSLYRTLWFCQHLRHKYGLAQVLRAIFLVAQPPLLCEEGNITRP